MELNFFVLLVLLAGLPSALSKPFQGIGVPAINVDAKNVIAGCYIVVYHDNATSSAITSHQALVNKAITKYNKRSNTKISASMKSFSINKMKGFSLEAGDGVMMSVANAAEVAYIEADTKVYANTLVTQFNVPIGLKRLSHQAVGSKSYVFDSTAGSGITVYVIDSGINVNHTEFGGRATIGVNYVNSVNTDENGHGTYCSGTITGTTYGVAKSAALVGVKVLDADGAVTTNAASPSKSVINMSLAGSSSRAVNEAVAAAVTAGITTVVAAGNENVDASNDSPASSASVITVGAIDSNDKELFSLITVLLSIFLLLA